MADTPGQITHVIEKLTMAGVIAVNDGGHLGLITMDYKQSGVYQGVDLLTGRPWFVQCPIVLGRFEQLIDSGMSFREWAAMAGWKP